MKTFFKAGCLVSLILLQACAHGQTILGKHYLDKVLPPFYQENGNANTTLQGLSLYGTGPFAVQALTVRQGLTLGGVTRTTWPNLGDGGPVFIASTLTVAGTSGGELVMTDPTDGHLISTLFMPATALPTSIRTANFSSIINTSGTWCNNYGATGGVTNALPYSAGGLQYGWVVVAAQPCAFQAKPGETIAYGPAAVSVPGGVLYSTAPNSTALVYCPVYGQWVVLFARGAWTVQ